MVYPCLYSLNPLWGLGRSAPNHQYGTVSSKGVQVSNTLLSLIFKALPTEVERYYTSTSDRQSFLRILFSAIFRVSLNLFRDYYIV